MPLSPETQSLIDQTEAALLNARVQLSQFQAASTGQAQRLTHDDYVALLARSQKMPWTLTASEQAQLDASGPINGMQLNAQFPACGDAWNPGKAAREKATAFASVADQRRVATYAAEHAAPVKDRRYYRVKWGSGDTGRAECSQHAASLKMTLPQYRDWLWADTPSTPTPGAHSSHQAWARRALGGAA
ncbi:hypothetical protein VB780_08020 [Leptolyngbya sp. CCNP1308]|uniref:hypothetical protein n=1 Tax=Leptolyngbya sp. CCNP1308 TaxID=3110255 RepID=UPI002B21D7C6|nr:hypothetical protein [Leptolyngbya sp. CCNP1308]MEA5448508.1 hypothetical protein [Leptolyngbya sp. CCNP1308]